MKRYRTRWLFTGTGPPIPHATIEISGACIDRVTGESLDAIDLGDVAILPGLINAHTHLEFSTITQPLQPLDDFARWIQAVVNWRRSQGDHTSAAIQAGIEESLTAGVTSIAEIATTDWRTAWEAPSPDQVRPGLIMFREILGLSEEGINGQLATAREFLARSLQAGITPALSPHAPYSVHPELFQSLCALAEEFGCLLAMHLAESPAELELLQSGTGPLAEMLSGMGVYRPELFAKPQRPLEFLQQLDRSVPVLVIHGNELSGEDLDFLVDRPHFSVVYCPRTHAAMQQRPHPWRQMLARGINVTLGTDSRASNPDLSIWGELQFLHQHFPEIPASSLLQLSTVNAAQALRLSDRGRLQAGMRADLCVVPLSPAGLFDPEQFLFAAGQTPRGTMISGEWVIPPELV